MTSLSMRNLRPRTSRKNPEILTPVPASWLVIRDREELRHILSVFPEGLLSDVMGDLIACPAVRGLTIRYDDSVAACQLVDAEHLRRYASPYVSEADSDGLFIRFFLPVRGHYRHYRSGKTIYIAPFVKGPERDSRECPGREYITGGKHDDKK